MKRIALFAVLVVFFPYILQSATFDFYLPWDDDTHNLVDMSYLNHKPAGVSGTVTAGADGRLYVNSGADRIKFLGTNVTSSSCFPDKADAPKLAKRMAKFGINIVRFHLGDTWQWGESVFDASGGTTRVLDLSPNGTIDRMDYFIKCLIDEGIYINMNTLSGRKFRSGDGLPASIDTMDWKDCQTPAMYYQDMIDLQKEHATQLLTHVNPYVGMALKDHPALVFVEVCNEHGLIHAWFNGQMDPGRLAPEFSLDLQSKWNTYLHTQYASHAALAAAWEATTAPGAEMLINGDFSSGLAGWTTEEHNGADANFTVTAEGVSGTPSARIETVTPGTEAWHIQFQQSSLNMAAGTVYTVSFWAKADRNKTIDVVLEQAHDPWAQMGFSQTMDLTTSDQYFEFTFTPSISDANARLNFRGMYDTAGLVVWLSQVSLAPGGAIGVYPSEDLDTDTINHFVRSDLGYRNDTAKHDWITFLWGLEETYWTQMRDHIKTTIGTNAFTIGTVVGNSTPNLMNIFDAIDSHAYWNHPAINSSWTEWSITNESMVGETNGGTMSGLALKKVAGKPFTVTEYNHPFPMSFDSEAYIFMSAYGALGDWDAIYTYTYDDGSKTWDINKQNGFFEIDRHPGKIMSLIHAACMYRRGDVSAANDIVSVPLPKATEIAILPDTGQWRLIDAEYAGMARETGIVYRTELVPEGGSASAGALSPGSVSVGGGDHTSDTGELRWNGNSGYLTIDTANTKGVLGYVTGQQFNLGGVIFRPAANMQNWASINMSLMQGISLVSGAERILISAHGFVSNNGITYYNESTGLPLSSPPPAGVTMDLGPTWSTWGGSPTIAEGIPCEFVVPYAWDHIKVYALDNRGDRVVTLPVQNEAGSARFTINDSYQTLWYEVEVYLTPAPTDTVTATPTLTITPGGPTNTPTYTVTLTPTVEEVLIDNCEDNNAQNLWGGYWYTYYDPRSTVTPVNGNFVMTAGGADSPAYAARYLGYIAPVITPTPSGSEIYSYVGLGTSLDVNAGSPTCARVDISSYSGIKFYAKGDGNSYRIAFAYTDGSCNSMTGDNNYGFIFTAPASWTQFTIPFTSLTQDSGWGTAVLLIDALRDVSDIQWQTDFRDGTFELWIDDLALYNSAGPTSTITPVVSPTITPTATNTALPASPTVTFTPPPTNTETPIVSPTVTPTPAVTPASDLEEVYIYPSMFDSEGDQEGIHFINLTGDCFIRIYNLRGDLVLSRQIINGNGRFFWQIKNTTKRREVPPGLYIYVITNGNEEIQKGKVAVVR